MCETFQWSTAIPQGPSMDRCTMRYDLATSRTIGAEATAPANYYQCLNELEGKMEFANV